MWDFYTIPYQEVIIRDGVNSYKSSLEIRICRSIDRFSTDVRTSSNAPLLKTTEKCSRDSRGIVTEPLWRRKLKRSCLKMKSSKTCHRHNQMAPYARLRKIWWAPKSVTMRATTLRINIPIQKRTCQGLLRLKRWFKTWHWLLINQFLPLQHQLHNSHNQS